MAKANELVAFNPGNPVGALQVSNIPGSSGIVKKGADEEEAQDPSIAQGEDMQGPILPSEVILVDKDDAHAISRVSKDIDAGGVETGDPEDTGGPRLDERVERRDDV